MPMLSFMHVCQCYCAWLPMLPFMQVVCMPQHACGGKTHACWCKLRSSRVQRQAGSSKKRYRQVESCPCQHFGHLASPPNRWRAGSAEGNAISLEECAHSPSGYALVVPNNLTLEIVPWRASLAIVTRTAVAASEAPFLSTDAAWMQDTQLACARACPLQSSCFGIP
eukprot:355638-Chlamydomonas_euryale.AAC.2